MGLCKVIVSSSRSYSIYLTQFPAHLRGDGLRGEPESRGLAYPPFLLIVMHGSDWLAGPVQTLSDLIRQAERVTYSSSPLRLEEGHELRVAPRLPSGGVPSPVVSGSARVWTWMTRERAG